MVEGQDEGKTRSRLHGAQDSSSLLRVGNLLSFADLPELQDRMGIKIGDKEFGKDLTCDRGFNLFMGATQLATGAWMLTAPNNMQETVCTPAAPRSNPLTRMSGTAYMAMGGAHVVAGCNKDAKVNQDMAKVVFVQNVVMTGLAAKMLHENKKEGAKGHLKENALMGLAVANGVSAVMSGWRGFRKNDKVNEVKETVEQVTKPRGHLIGQTFLLQTACGWKVLC
eukprot:TRINITY_DN1089_c0_g1_i1.p2 TRINITY_DN1089_c0_g1~~TRINITY_DN1089_c0_g1_i1.p2  ORF type:complete len:238 (-),score=32.96 TRINITY_DN1089_c0_g1_i1:322-993(-)